MRHPQIVLFEHDAKLARQLAELGESQRWRVSETRQGPACIALLRRHAPAVFVLKVGRNLHRELALLREVHGAVPDVPVVVVGDTEDVLLEALVYNLGASFVLQPPLSRPQLAELVEHMMRRAVERIVRRPRFEPPDTEGSDDAA